MAVNTIKDLIDMAYAVHAFCNACGYNCEVSLAEAPGDMTVPYMRKNLVCSACGSGDTDMKIFQKVNPGGFH